MEKREWEKTIEDMVKEAYSERANEDTTEVVQEKQPKLNRAQRRAKQKIEAKKQRQMRKKLNRYIEKHPEAVQVQLDDEKISAIENTKEVKEEKVTEGSEANQEVNN